MNKEDFIVLVNEYSYKVIARISNIDSVQEIETGVRIFWKSNTDEHGDIIGEDYNSSFKYVSEMLTGFGV